VVVVVHVINVHNMNDAVNQMTQPSPLSSIVKSRRLSLFGHVARINELANANQILFAQVLDNWRRPTGRHGSCKQRRSVMEQRMWKPSCRLQVRKETRGGDGRCRGLAVWDQMMQQHLETM